MSLSEQIEIVWNVNDILIRAKDKDINLSKDKALDVLHEIKHHHDANIGINWTVIDCYLELTT